MITEQLGAAGVIPVVSLDTAGHAIPLANALREGGLNLMEITFRTEAAAVSIRALRSEVPDMIIGAGTLLHPDQVDAAVESGAQFGVAPGFNPKVVKRAHSKGLPFFPGVCTPTDIEAALDLGCKVLKFFPAETYGGLKGLKAIQAPYEHLGIQFIPTGGMKLETVPDYLALKTVLAVGGTWIAPADFIRQEDWDEIRNRSQAAAHRIKHLDRG